jgi:hypothetical protein
VAFQPQGGLIEENVANGAGTSAIGLYYTDSVTVQHNETFGTKVKAGGADSNGMDTSIPSWSRREPGRAAAPPAPAFGSLGGYQLAAGSPAINAGLSIANNGGMDFWGDTLYVGAADIGAYKAP